MTRAQQQKDHLQFLWREIQSRPEVQRALDLRRSLTPQQFAWLLRHHDEGTVTGSETDDRDAWDSLLGAYSQLTVAAIAGYVPPGFGAAITAEIVGVLADPPVQTYYERHYRLLLPSLLRLHCAGAMALPRDPDQRAWGAFQWFWRFASRFRMNPELDDFLWLLDAGSFGDFDAAAFRRLLKNPTVALAGLTKPPSERTPGESAVLGMIRFLELCQELGETLRDMDDIPLTRSAIWFFHAYWFEEFQADVASRAVACMRIMREWVQQSAVETRNAAGQSEERVLRAVRELTSGVYSEALLDAVKSKS